MVVAALVGCCVAFAQTQTEKPPPPPEASKNVAPAPAADVVSAAYCSREHLGLSVVELRWPLSESAGSIISTADAKALLGRQTIDVTTYADGFERQLFATLTDPAVGKKFRTRAPGQQYEQTKQPKDLGKSLPGLGRLAITDVVTASAPATASPLRLLMAPGIRTETVVVRISGLEGGMDYQWRVPSFAGGTVVVTCTAARCPVDDFEPAKKKSPPAKAQPKGGAK